METEQVQKNTEKRNIVAEFEDKQIMSRSEDKGFVNPINGASIRLNANGDIVLASNTQAQYRMSNNAQIATELTMQSNTITNRKVLLADEIVVNKHKLNPQVVEYSNFVNDNGALIGGLTMMTTVLVKAWEPTLKRYVLIRRLARTPLFSPMINLSDTPINFGINTEISEDLKMLDERPKSSSEEGK